jgi:hypothetical protein
MRRILLFLGLSFLAISNNCFAQPTNHSLIVIIDPVECFGDSTGSIDLLLILDTAGTIGPGPYNYDWSNSDTTSIINNLTAGSYSVILTDSLGVTYTDTFSISEPLLIITGAVAGSINTLGGNDGSINITTSSLNHPISYNWSNLDTTQNINNLFAGIYNLTVTNNIGCSQDTTFYLESPSPGNYNNWIVGSSANYHTFFIEDNSCVTLNDTALSYGSLIGAFFEDGSQLKCAGKFFWNGQPGSFDVGITLSGQGYGIPVGDLPIIWRVYDAASGNTYEAHCCSDSQYMPAISVFYPTGYTSLYCVKARTTYVQTLSFDPGWNMFGVYLEPDEANAVDFFAPVVNNLQIIKDEWGLAYWPAYNVNLLGDIQVGKGYMIKANAVMTLNIQGSFFYAENKPLLLNQGWGIFAYYSTTPQSASEVFYCSGFPSCSIELIKNNYGQIFWPFYGLNTIGNLIPGQGYLVKSNYPGVYGYLQNACDD